MAITRPLFREKAFTPNINSPRPCYSLYRSFLSVQSNIQIINRSVPSTRGTNTAKESGHPPFSRSTAGRPFRSRGHSSVRPWGRLGVRPAETSKCLKCWMSTSNPPNLPASARRHLEAADALYEADRRKDVAGYLYGVATECALTIDLFSLFYKHFPWTLVATTAPNCRTMRDRIPQNSRKPCREARHYTADTRTSTECSR